MSYIIGLGFKERGRGRRISRERTGKEEGEGNRFRAGERIREEKGEEAGEKERKTLINWDRVSIQTVYLIPLFLA